MVKELIQLSKSVAKDISAIQGAGGNTSVKDSDTLFVKASGTLLSEMSSEKGWAKLTLQQWRRDFQQFHSTSEDEFVAINTNNTIEGGRASIETGLHALLPHKYVLHTHSVYANIFLCGGQTQQLVNYINQEYCVSTIVIPMCAPGLMLTNYLSEQLQSCDTSQPIIVLLENHGIAVSCDDLEQTIQLHDYLHNKVQKCFKLPLFELPLLSHEQDFYFFRENNTFTSFIQQPIVFFPDQIVYVNNKLTTQIVLNHQQCKFLSMSKQQVKNVSEIFIAVLYLYENIQMPQILPKNLCEYISNMSGEKYRQLLEK